MRNINAVRALVYIAQPIDVSYLLMKHKYFFIVYLLTVKLFSIRIRPERYNIIEDARHAHRE